MHNWHNTLNENITGNKIFQKLTLKFKMAASTGARRKAHHRHLKEIVPMSLATLVPKMKPHTFL